MIFCILILPAGLCCTDVPPADCDSALSQLADLMRSAEPEALGMFFAEIGLEASPDEVQLWESEDFLQMVLDLTPEAPDSASAYSLLWRIGTLPVELLEKSCGEPVTMLYGSSDPSSGVSYRSRFDLGGLF